MTDVADLHLLKTRAWKTSDGDPCAPRRVLGRQVTRVLLVSDERTGSVVLLADGRCALTGHRLVVGSVEAVRAYARGRAFKSGTDEATRHWLHGAADRLTALAAERERNAASL